MITGALLPELHVERRKYHYMIEADHLKSSNLEFFDNSKMYHNFKVYVTLCFSANITETHLFRMKTPFFTIITASYNNNRTIKKTISSIKNQSFRNFEHIVIDGGSTDQTVSILRDNSDQHCLRYISEKDDGIADAMNKGIKLSNGLYIIFIHADDYLLDENILQNAHDELCKTKAEIFAGSILLHRYNNKFIKQKPIKILWWYQLRSIIKHQGAFTHKRVFEKIGLFNTEYKIAMDYDFFYRAIKNKIRILFSDSPITVMGSDGISNNFDFISRRLKEDFHVQKRNNNNIFIHMLYLLFQPIYFHVKIKIVELHKRKQR